ncbi:hypothetical protein AURDEDRAFT_168143 [Auricularia subglabra TFB-10046 SS5]|nr:hypothetical protein AURDEDRAFT_168143 [Auricularia subglabra TFB-10046 SS5]
MDAALSTTPAVELPSAEGQNSAQALHDPMNDLPDVLRQLDIADSLVAIGGSPGAVIPAVHPAQALLETGSDPVIALPPELVAEIFRYLDFAHRLAVSHVCWSWRRSALSNPSLWSTYTVPVRVSVQRRIHQVSGLAALLARSSPLPFKLRCHGAATGGILDLVIAHMARVEVLDFGVLQTDDWRRLLEVEAPLLKHFASRWFKSSVEIPFTVPAHWSLRLEHLKLGSPCSWPVGCVFTSLHSFTGRMPNGRGFGGPISRIFPSIRRLKLTQVSQTVVEEITPLPRSLTVLRLETASDGRVDCTDLLRNCTAQDLCELDVLYVSNTSSVLEALRLFNRTVTRPWRFQVTRDAMMARASPYYYVVHCAIPAWISLEPAMPLCWDLLCELVLSMDELPHVLAAFSPGLALPALSSVIVTIGFEFQFDHEAAENIPQIDAPSLRSVELRAGADCDCLSDVVRMMLRTFRAPVLLSNLVVGTGSPDGFPRERFAETRGFVERVEVRNLDGKICSTFDLLNE